MGGLLLDPLAPDPNLAAPIMWRDAARSVVMQLLVVSGAARSIQWQTNRSTIAYVPTGRPLRAVGDTYQMHKRK